MEDFIPIYPSASDPDIQRIITSKKEFNELKPDMSLGLQTGERKLMNHQELFARLSTITDRMLNIHETGTGKTCAFIAMAEKYKLKGAFRKCIILEKSDTLINEVKKQILNTCTPEGEYSIVEETDEGEDLTARARKKRQNQTLKSWYEFSTYETFANSLEDLTDEQITSKYDKHIFVFDEAHNIITDRNVPGIPKRYFQYQRLCFNVPRSKLCFVSATPMTNGPQEIIYLMNLLQDPNNQIPLKNAYRLSELEPYFRGKISYIKPRIDGAPIKYMGKRFEFSQEIMDLHPTDPSLDRRGPTNVKVPINMYLSKLGDLQETQLRDEPRTLGFRPNELAHASMVFPIIDGKKTDWKDYYTEDGGKLRWKSNPNFLNWEERGKYINFHDWIYNDGNLDNLRRISGKLSEIINIENSNPGCSFIFFRLVEGSGVKMYSLIFQLFGYDIFSESSLESIFVNPSNASKSKVKDSFVKKLRIGIITSGSHGNDNRQNALLELFNSDANVNGEYIKIILGSEKARDGINVYHCRRMHLVSPLWTYSGMIQAINRTLRATGHFALKDFKVKEALKLGYKEGSDEYNKHTDITVEIYRHCIDYHIDANIRGETDDNVDYSIMKIAVEKEIRITKMMNMLKMCAMDALINRPMNALRDNDPFNFDNVKYLPSWTEIIDSEYVPYITDPMDYSTYNILYIKTDHIVNRIQHILLNNGSISYDSIYEYFNDFTKEEIYTSIEDLKSKGRYIENYLGEKMSLETSENGIHIQRFSQTKDSRFIGDISIYDFPQLVSSKKSISEFLSVKKNLMIKRIMTKLIREENSIDKYKERMLKYLKSLDRWSQMMILEEVIYMLLNVSTFESLLDTQEIKVVLDLFKGYFYDFSNEDPPVYLHVLTTTIDQETSHNVAFKHEDPTQVKILDPRENRIGWRLPYDEEDSKYRKLIKERIERDVSKFEKFKTYGTILQDGKFRLIDENIYEKEVIISEDGRKEDKRMNQRGSEPKSIKKKVLIKIAVAENIEPTCGKNQGKQEPVKYIREAIKADHPEKYVNSLSDDQVKLYYRWENCSNVAKIFQKEVVDKLRVEGRLYEPYILTY